MCDCVRLLSLCGQRSSLPGTHVCVGLGAFLWGFQYSVRQYQDVSSPWIIPTVFFITLIMLGANFLLELMLAVIWDRFSTVQAQLLVDKEAAELNATQEAVGYDSVVWVMTMQCGL